MHMFTGLLQRLPAPGRRFVIGVPMAWLLFFFMLPFLVLLYISFVDMGNDIHPFKPLWDSQAGVLRLKYENYSSIFAHAEGSGYSVVREFCGHGIGRKFHEEPQVLHYGRAGTGMKLQAGMTFTIEPMINAGKPGIRELADGWTIVTKDHSLSAQWEHTVLVTESGFEILTQSEGTPPPPAG